MEQERYGYIELTDEGKVVAHEIYSRHLTLFRFFRDVLGVDARVANQDACMMEHYLSEETLTKLKRFVERLLEGGE